MKKSRSRPSAPRARRSASYGRILLRAVLAAVVLGILVGAAGSIALHRILVSGKIKGWVNGDPEKFRLEYASASGWFPWDVRVSNLELRSRDPNVEFYLKLERGKFSFAPFALLAHRFHVRRLRGEGLTYRLRTRPDRPGTAAEHFAALPPIPGFPARPLENDPPPGSAVSPPPGSTAAPNAAAPAAPEPAETGKKHAPFHIEIEDIRIDRVTELWVDIWKWSGEAGTLSGSFRLWPGRSAQVGPARLEGSRGALSVGSHGVARAASFSTEVAIREFDSQAVHGNAVWPYISAKVRLDGELVGLGFLNYFIDGEPRLSGGQGTAHFALDVDRGKGKGAVSLSSRAVAARYKEARLRGETDVALRIAGWDFDTGRIDIGGSRVELKHFSAEEPGPDSRDWWGRFDFPAADIVPGRPATFAAKVKIHARDARPLFTLFRVGLPGWVRGLLTLDGFDAAARVGLGSSDTEIENLDAAGSGYRIRGRYLERRRETRGAFLVEKGILAVGLEIDAASSKLKLVGARSWFEDTAGKPEKASRPTR